MTEKETNAVERFGFHAGNAGQPFDDENDDAVCDGFPGPLQS